MSRFISIKTKLLSLVLGGILMTIGLIAASTLVIDYYIIQDLDRRADLNLKGATQLFEDYKDQALAHATNLASRSEVVAAVLQQDRQALAPLAASLMTHGRLDYLTVTDHLGNVLARGHNPTELPQDNIVHQANIRHALEGNPFAAIEEGNQVKLSVRAGTPIRDAQGRIIGALSTGYVISNNKILGHAKKLFGADFSILIGGQRAATTLSGDRLDYREDPNLLQAATEERKMRIGRETIAGEKHVTGYLPLYGNDGQMVAVLSTLVPFSLVSYLKDAILGNIFFYSSFVLLAAAWVGYLLARRFVKPIQALQSHMERVGREQDYSIHAEILSNDEIGQLTLAFNQMIRRQADALAEHARLDQAILQSERRLREITSAVGEGIFVMDINGQVTFMNPEAERLLGWSEAELLGKDAHETIHSGHDRSVAREQCPVHLCLQTGKIQRCDDDSFVRKDGTFLPVAYVATPLTSGDSVIGSVIAFQDITDRKQAAEALKFQAYYDSLTGLPNRTYFQILVQDALERAKKTNTLLGVMFIDLNRLKWINDTLGHAVGDVVLDRVSQRLAGVVGVHDTLARFGGDEFTILMPNIMGEEDVIAMANRVVAILSEALHLEGHEIFLSASIGACIAPTFGDTMETLLKNADMALLQAKEQGRNSFKLYVPDMDRITSERLLMENHLRKAIELKEFEIHYQPQIDSRTGAIIGMEALLRWNHTQWGYIPPSKFIPVAEESGVIIPITEWVLHTACAQNKAWQDEGLPKIPVGVNISATHFQQKELVDLVSKVLEETGLEPQYLDLEITETISVYDFDSVVSTLQALDRLGVEISIDDFGTGYSSLNYLRQFPIDTLKIDQTFIRDIEESGDGTIAEAIIAMARTLNLKVTAEGVETDWQKNFLEQLGCDKLQGYIFSKPLPPEGLKKLLQEQAKQQRG